MCISTICNTCACRMASKRFQQFYILYSDRRFFRFKQRDTGDYATTNSVFSFFSFSYLSTQRIQFDGSRQIIQTTTTWTYRIAFTSGELLWIPTGVMSKRSFCILLCLSGAQGTGLRSFNIVATGTCGWQRGGRENQMKKLKKDYSVEPFRALWYMRWWWWLCAGMWWFSPNHDEWYWLHSGIQW